MPSKGIIAATKEADFEIPVIDIGDDVDEERVVTQIAKASSEFGLFQVINHGIPSDVVAKLQSVGKEFFELPRQEKETYAKLPGSLEGYGTALQKEKEGQAIKEAGDHLVAHLFHKIWPQSAINYRFWPTIPTSYREANEEYAKYLRKVSDKLFRCLSLGLGLQGHELREDTGGDNMEYLLKINYYPPCDLNDLDIGVGAHTDMSAITLLVPNHVPGLQFFMHGHWYDVDYVPNALIIHIGDQTEIISNGKYKAVLHRTTLDKDRTRLSWPVFVEPPSGLTLGPNSKLVSQENPAKYKTKKYRDYVYCKLNKIPQ